MPPNPKYHDLGGRIVQSARTFMDFPQEGIAFKDITPVLADADLFRDVTEALAEGLGDDVKGVVGIEARGFIFAAAVARARHLPLLLARKPGKLPGPRHRELYSLEYGSDALELHQGLLPGGCSVGIVDDVLATGGTAAAAGRLSELAGYGVASWAFVLEIDGLGGRGQLNGTRVTVLAQV